MAKAEAPRPDPGALRRQVLEDLRTMRVPVHSDQLDDMLARAEREHLTQLDFLALLVGEQAALRRQRSTERRIREAHFAEHKSLETFDWKFNQRTIKKAEIEELATCEFIRRQDNLVWVGQSGVGKSHLIQGIGMRACALGYRVRYTTSAVLITELNASLADQSFPQVIRHYARSPEWLIIDEFGFDKIEREECSRATNLLYKVIDARAGRSTAIVTNVDFDKWADYLGDPPLAMAFLDRVVDGAIIHRFKGRSYRAARSKRSRMNESTSKDKDASDPDNDS
jgi:DNA replication protein DnaC